ncbi:thymidylate synthase [Candidatus Woesearchaeota archaeon]|nr:thymidylate synthase [Candidatus Woesearchaeota archaeon]MCF8013580.1 thymidylate synthase [Candidatus Woesearchaeota archaeon]
MELIKNDALSLWKESLRYVLSKGEDYKDNDGRVCREVFNFVMTLSEDATNIEGPIDLMRKSKIWIYPSKEELSSIMFKINQAPIYEYTYGGRIFNFSGQFDQVNEFIVPLLKKDFSSRRAVMSIYNPLQDSDINNRNTPGIIYLHFRIKENKLWVTAHIRSNDLFFGWPANLYQLYELQNSIAKELKIEKGKLTVISDSAHIFLDDQDRINEVVGVLND